MIIVNDKMQTEYSYERVRSEGDLSDLDELGFSPMLSPVAMLEMGVFGGKYMTDCVEEFPEWYSDKVLRMMSPTHYDSDKNYFKVPASSSLEDWLSRGWINSDHDPRGWFQWYCRAYSGRRIPEYDNWQIGRWRSVRRHVWQVLHNCDLRDTDCRRVQRQACLHWSYLLDGSVPVEDIKLLLSR